jgi:proteasome lid subunit RPN8/RPN11
MKLLLPPALHSLLARAALDAFPRECCGLIEGMAVDDGLRAIALHPARNLAAAPDCFELDPADHIAAMKAARANGHILIGCYHSHPNGRAAPSRSDLGGAAQENFLWLIAATDGRQCRLAAFAYRPAGFEDVVLTSKVGADLATSSLKDRN